MTDPREHGILVTGVPLSRTVEVVRQIVAMVATFTPTFNAWRFYADGTESGSSPLAAQDTNVTVTVNTDQKVHLRVRVQETAGAAGLVTDDWQLQYERNDSGTWVNVTASSSYVKADTASSLTDGGATTNRGTNGITDGTGSFVAGEQEEANGVIEDHQLTASNFTEHVWALTLVAADIVDGDTFDFRISLNGGAPGMTNSVEPRITGQKTDKTGTDTTTATDALTALLATVSPSDAATASESGTLAADLTPADALAVAEAATLALAATVPETASLSETEAISLTLTATDAATVTDTESAVSGGGGPPSDETDTDTSTVVEAAQTHADIWAQDTWACAEAAAVAVAVAPSDTATTTEALAWDILWHLVEQATVTDALAWQVAWDVADTATLTDSATAGGPRLTGKLFAGAQLGPRVTARTNLER